MLLLPSMQLVTSFAQNSFVLSDFKVLLLSIGFVQLFVYFC